MFVCKISINEERVIVRNITTINQSGSYPSVYSLEWTHAYRRGCCNRGSGNWRRTVTAVLCYSSLRIAITVRHFVIELPRITGKQAHRGNKNGKFYLRMRCGSHILNRIDMSYREGGRGCESRRLGVFNWTYLNRVILVIISQHYLI